MACVNHELWNHQSGTFGGEVLVDVSSSWPYFLYSTAWCTCLVLWGELYLRKFLQWDVFIKLFTFTSFPTEHASLSCLSPNISEVTILMISLLSNKDRGFIRVLRNAICSVELILQLYLGAGFFFQPRKKIIYLKPEAQLGRALLSNYSDFM